MHTYTLRFLAHDIGRLTLRAESAEQAIFKASRLFDIPVALIEVESVREGAHDESYVTSAIRFALPETLQLALTRAATTRPPLGAF